MLEAGANRRQSTSHKKRMCLVNLEYTVNNLHFTSMSVSLMSTGDLMVHNYKNQESGYSVKKSMHSKII